MRCGRPTRRSSSSRCACISRATPRHGAQSARADILTAFRRAEKEPKPKISELFEDVYDELTPALHDQKEQMRTHIAKYTGTYPIAKHEKEESWSDIYA